MVGPMTRAEEDLLGTLPRWLRFAVGEVAESSTEGAAVVMFVGCAARVEAAAVRMSCDSRPSP